MLPLFRRGPRPAETPGSMAAAPPVPTMSVSPPRRPGEAKRLGKRYTLRRMLGEGGEASVYAAWDDVLGRTVAIKLFHRVATPPTAGALEAAEARVAAALSHYALTALFDAGIDVGPDGAPQLYIVMEYVPGETLTARLRRAPMSPAEACWLGFDLAEGLDHMHQVGFVHRDVKPSNILISGLRSVRPVVAKLTDFGIAAPVGEPDLSEYTVGTAAYLSPEQVEGHDAVPASDTYSLGIVLLEAITGRVVFPGSVTESAFARLTTDPEIPGEVPARTAALLRRMTERRPADRIGLYDAAVEMQQILADALLQDRGRTGAAPPAVAEPIDARDLVDLRASSATDAAVRLAAAGAGVSRALLLADDPDGTTRIVGAHGWPERPSVMEGWPLRSGDGAEVWAVPDLLSHPTLSVHPVTEAPHDVRAIAGVPLRSSEGRIIGLLCVADTHPVVFAGARMRAIEDAAELLRQDLQLRSAVRRAVFRAE